MPGLDKVLQGLLPGDNVVWEVDSIEDYLPVLGPLCSEASRLRRKLIYFRFARHAPLLKDDCGAEIYQLNPEEGFERFLTEILDVIERAGPGAYYIFDCLSDLAADWFSDRMLGNFFMITCPYLYELDTIAYFRAAEERPFLPRHPADLQHRPDHPRGLSQGEPALHPSDEGVAALLADHVHAAQLGGRRVQAGDQQRHHHRHPGQRAEALAGVHHSPPGRLGAHLPGGPARRSMPCRPARPRPTRPPELFQRLTKMLVTRDERMAALAAKLLRPWPTWWRSCSG